MSIPPSGPWAPITWIGGQNGTDFSFTRFDPANNVVSPIRSLTVWWGSAWLRGIEATFADGTHLATGTIGQDSSAIFNIGPEERISMLTLWGNGDGQRAGHVKIETDTGRVFDVGKDVSGQRAYSAEVGSGILMGVFGRNGSDIDSLGFVLFKSPISKIQITNMIYTPNIADTDIGTSIEDLAHATYENPTENPVSWTFSNSETVTVMDSWSSSTTQTWGNKVDIEFSGTVFGVGVKTTAGFNWTESSTTGSSSSQSDTKTLTWGLQGTLKAGESVACTAVTRKGSVNLSYSSNVTFVLQTGESFSYSESGQYKNLAYTNADAKAESVPTSLTGSASTY